MEMQMSSVNVADRDEVTLLDLWVVLTHLAGNLSGNLANRSPFSIDGVINITMGCRRDYYVPGKTRISKRNGDCQIVWGSCSFPGIHLADEAVFFAGHSFPLEFIPIMLCWKSCAILRLVIVPQAYFAIIDPNYLRQTEADRQKITTVLR